MKLLLLTLNTRKWFIYKQIDQKSLLFLRSFTVMKKTSFNINYKRFLEYLKSFYRAVSPVNAIQTLLSCSFINGRQKNFGELISILVLRASVNLYSCVNAST